MRLLRDLGSIVVTLLLLGELQAQQAPKMPKEAAEVLQYLEGEWQVSGRIGNDKITGTFTARAVPGRYALITRDSQVFKGETIRRVGVLGWDPAEERLRHFGFSEDNEIFLNHWNVNEAGEWIGEISGTQKGEKFSAAFKITKKTNGFIFESEDEGEEIIYTKKEKKKEQEPRKKEKLQ